ncbi:MAG: type II toxin-antitoxin system RelE/ParE family toxin [Alphaproteobacteria bacterium]|nr:type II toxin-antitoxin system RelE/ParE family toxin [Alphaproteobacteria bacterium]
MTYELEFLEQALKEWHKLPKAVREQFKKKLAQRLTNPKAPKDKLSTLKDCYKIKLRSIGYRLVYQVFDDRVVVQVVAVGKRDKSAVYKAATGRARN